MQGLHKGTEAMLLPSLLAAVPFVSTLLYVSRPKSSSMYLYALPPPTRASCFFWVTAWHSATKCSLRQREVISVSWGGFFSLDVFLCCSLHRQLWCVLSFCIPSCVFMVFTQKCSPGCIKPQFKQTSCTFILFIIHLIKDSLIYFLFLFIYLFLLFFRTRETFTFCWSSWKLIMC